MMILRLFYYQFPEKTEKQRILGLQPIPGDPKDNGVAAMLDDGTFCFPYRG